LILARVCAYTSFIHSKPYKEIGVYYLIKSVLIFSLRSELNFHYIYVLLD